MKTARIAAASALALLLLAFLRPAVAPAQQGGSGGMSWEQQKSYAIGHDLGAEIRAGLEQDGVKVDHDALVQGFADALRAAEPKLSHDEMGRALARVHHEVSSRLVEDRLKDDPVFKALHDENMRKSREFLAAFAKRDGAQRLPSEILYIVQEKGDGPAPKESDTIVVSYRAMLQNGLEVANVQRTEVPVETMLVGPRALATSMHVGDRWIAAIPPEQAFGAAGMPPEVGPNETLIVDVTLHAVK